MSTNLSKQKRDELITKIKAIHKYIASATPDENTGALLGYIAELEKAVKAKKYGLVFEEHREAIDEILETHVPVLNEQKDLFVDNGGKMNFLIEGDNLAALQLLLKTHKGKIDVIYIDPPYNNGNSDFIYDDNRVDKTDTFKHSKWLSFMRCRLEKAKILLRSTGAIFISLNDIEQAQMKLLCDSVFNEDNFCGQLIWQKKTGGGQTDEFFVTEHEYVLLYRKSASFKWLDKEIPLSAKGYPGEDEKGKYKLVKLAKWGTAARKEDRPTMHFPIKDPEGKNIYPIAPDGTDGRWRVGKKTMNLLLQQQLVEFKNENDTWLAYEKVYFDDDDVKVLKFRSILYGLAETGDGTKALTEIFGKKDIFQNPKPVELIKELLSHTKNSIILDFFAGSGTTGHATLELNQEGANSSFILCTNNENNICQDVTYERIKRVIKNENYPASLKYYKIDFVPISEQIYYEYADTLLLHIRELVELENGLNFAGNQKVAIVLTDAEVSAFFKDIETKKACRKLYIGHDLLLTGEQEGILKKRRIALAIIPEYYYRDLEA